MSRLYLEIFDVSKELSFIVRTINSQYYKPTKTTGKYINTYIPELSDHLLHHVIEPHPHLPGWVSESVVPRLDVLYTNGVEIQLWSTRN